MRRARPVVALILAFALGAVLDRVALSRSSLPDGPTADQRSAHDGAVRLLSDALTAGVWKDDDRAALRALMPRMTRDQIDDVLATLFPALNEGRLRPAFGRHPAI